MKFINKTESMSLKNFEEWSLSLPHSQTRAHITHTQHTGSFKLMLVLLYPSIQS
jgi:hypothetical protein